MLFLTLCSALAAGASAWKVDTAELTLRMIESSNRNMTLSEEQKAQIRRQMNLPAIKGATLASGILGPQVVIFLVAVVYFALFTVLGRDCTFKTFCSITTYAFIPQIFRQFAAVLTIYVVPSSALVLDELGSLGPSVFVDRDSVSPALFAGIASVDVVSIWILALLVIGYKFTKQKGFSVATRTSAVVAVFLIYVVLRMAGAALQGLSMGG